MMPSISVISPTRPTNISSATSSLLSSPNRGVRFKLDPTVLNADTHSKVMAKSDVPGSRMLMMKINSNKTPNDITTVALERRMESCDSSRPNTSTRSVPRNTATRFSTTTAKAFTLIPPAVDCEPPPILDGHGINYYIPQPEQPNGSCNFVAFTDKATMTFTTNRPMKMVYTLDGTEPTPESTVYTAPFDITETTTVKIASVLPSGKMGKPRTILVEKQTLAPAKEVAKTAPGLDMEVFDGMYLSVNNLEAAQKTGKKQVIKTTRELTNQVPAPESMRGVKQYAAIATGYVNIPEDGVYYISSDLEEVWIDGKLMVNNGGEVKRFSRHDTSAALAKGLHEIKLVFLGHIIGGWPSNWNDGSVQLRKSDAEKFTPITAEMLSH